jgi:acyl carrier protein
MLPDSIMAFLNEAALQSRTKVPERDASLFLSGVLDSFSLVDLVTVIETEFGIRVADSDLRPETFDTISRVEAFIARATVTK